MFLPSLAEEAFHQGEILSSVVQLYVLPESLPRGMDGLEFGEIVHPYAVVLTQECDLDWDFKARSTETIERCRNSKDEENKRQLKLAHDILLCEAFLEEEMRPKIRGSDIWKRIMGNQDERYHRIREVSPDLDLRGEGVPAIILDFKRMFTIPTEELYQRIALGLGRRARLQVPWVQDLGNRSGYYNQRVALPDPQPAAFALPVPALALPAAALPEAPPIPEAPVAEPPAAEAPVVGASGTGSEA